MDALNKEENTLKDIWEDLISGRWYEYFNIPKVKFVTTLASHVCYIGLVMYMGQSNPGLNYDGQLATEVEATEIIVWIWTCAILYAELRQLNSYDLDGFRMYIRSPWNKMDMWNCCSILTVMVFRLHCWQQATDTSTCDDLQSWSRCLYALTEFTLVLRTLNYLMVYESLGVLVIILIEMLANDVSLFLVLALMVSLGTGFSFKLLMPGLERTIDSNIEFANLPLFLPIWGLLGMGDLAESQTIGYESPSNIIVPVLYFVYLILATIVLINLLIAQMSATYERVKTLSREEWLFNRAEIILESKDEKGPVPPPLNVIKSLINDIPKLIHWALGEIANIVKKFRFAETAVNATMKFTEGAVGAVADASGAVVGSTMGGMKKKVTANEFREGFKLVPPNGQMLRELRKKEQIALKGFLEYEQSLSSETLPAFRRELDSRLNGLEEQNRVRFDQLVGFVLRQEHNADAGKSS